MLSIFYNAYSQFSGCMTFLVMLVGGAGLIGNIIAVIVLSRWCFFSNLQSCLSCISALRLTIALIRSWLLWISWTGNNYHHRISISYWKCQIFVGFWYWSFWINKYCIMLILFDKIPMNWTLFFFIVLRAFVEGLLKTETKQLKMCYSFCVSNVNYFILAATFCLPSWIAQGRQFLWELWVQF